MSRIPRRTVACLLKKGKAGYTPEWVYKLRQGVTENLSVSFDFVCLSDFDLPGVDTIPIKNGWPRWWSKVELFQPGLFPGPVLYLDLDNLIVGALDEMFDIQGFTMCRDFISRPDAGFNSSVMAWNVDVSEIFAEAEMADDATRERYDRGLSGRIGDQAFIEDHIAQPLKAFPDGRVVSYKWGCKGVDGPPSGASVVAFHGNPKQNAVDGWPKAMWGAL